MDYDLIRPVCAEQIRRISPFRILDPVHCPDGAYIFLCKPHSTDHLYIHHVLIVKILVPRIPHIRFRGADPREKGAADRHDKKDGKKTPEAAPDLHIKIFSQRFFLHLLPLPFYLIDRYRMFVHLHLGNPPVLDMYQPVRHRRDRLVMRDHDDRHPTLPAHILEEL